MARVKGIGELDWAFYDWQSASVNNFPCVQVQFPIIEQKNYITGLDEYGLRFCLNLDRKIRLDSDIAFETACFGEVYVWKKGGGPPVETNRTKVFDRQLMTLSSNFMNNVESGRFRAVPTKSNIAVICLEFSSQVLPLLPDRFLQSFARKMNKWTEERKWWGVQVAKESS